MTPLLSRDFEIEEAAKADRAVFAAVAVVYIPSNKKIVEAASMDSHSPAVEALLVAA